MEEVPPLGNQVAFVTGNHRHMIGIEDHIDILREILELDKTQAPTSENLVPGKINFVIEEMSQACTREQFSKFKAEHFDSKIVLVLTEFPTRIGRQLSYNEFLITHFLLLRLFLCLNHLGKIFLQISELLRRQGWQLVRRGPRLFSAYKQLRRQGWQLVRRGPRLFLAYKQLYKDRVPCAYRSKMQWFLYCIRFLHRAGIRPFVRRVVDFTNRWVPGRHSSGVVLRGFSFGKFKYLRDFKYVKYLREFEYVKRNIRDYEYAKYMRERASGTMQTRDCFDLILAFHPGIVPLAAQLMGLRAHCIYPLVADASTEILKKRKTLPLGLFVTGSITYYRKKVVHALSPSDGIENATYQLHTKGFLGDSEEYSRGFASVNIPQTPQWGYSSPVRVYRSLRYGLLPIVTHVFGDHLIERIAAVVEPGKNAEVLDNIDTKLKSLKQDIDTYNTSARYANFVFLKKLELLAQSLPIIAEQRT